MEFKEEVSEEELDNIADQNIEVLKNITSYFKLGDIEINEYEGDENELILDLEGEDLSILIGKKGATISALQQLTSIIVSQKLGYRYPVLIDVHSYIARQKEKLEDFAFRMANKAINQKKKINLRPMSAYERRLIHIALRDEKNIETYSEGEGKDRHLILNPIIQ